MHWRDILRCSVVHRYLPPSFLSSSCPDFIVSLLPTIEGGQGACPLFVDDQDSDVWCLSSSLKILHIPLTLAPYFPASAKSLTSSHLPRWEVSASVLTCSSLSHPLNPQSSCPAPDTPTPVSSLPVICYHCCISTLLAPALVQQPPLGPLSLHPLPPTVLALMYLLKWLW